MIGFALGVLAEKVTKSSKEISHPMHEMLDSSIKELEEGQELEMFATISKKHSDCGCCDVLNPDNIEIDFRLN